MPRSLLDLNSPPVAVMPLVRRFLALQRAEAASTERNSEISPLLARAIELERRKQAKEASCLGDPDATIVIDIFTMSAWMSQWFHARFSGQILDAGPLAPVGHGVGGDVRFFPARFEMLSYLSQKLADLG